MSEGRRYIERQEVLPFFRPDLGDAEIDAVGQVLRSGWLTYGAQVREFGRRCADYLKVDHAVPVASASAGLFLALKALGIGEGDEVILPPITFISTLSAVVHCGATPVLADIEPRYLGLDPEAFARAITPRTRCVIPVHMAGHPCRLPEILATARQHGIKVVEDAAHSFGTRLDGTLLGGFGDATVFSFYATKNFTTGDGGLVTTQDPDLAEKVRMLSFHGMDGNAWQRYSGRGSWYYEVVEYGFKYHLGDPAAALGLVQLGRADAFLARRTEIAARYSQALADLPGVRLPEQADWATHAWHLYVLRVDPERIREGRDGLIEDLQANQLGSSVHFIPLYKHPVWAKGGLPAEGLVEAEKYFHSCVSLPLFPAMTEDEIEDVITVVRRSLADRQS